MPSIEEIGAWSLDEIRGEIVKIIPAGWSFQEGREDRWFHVSFIKTGEPEEPPFWSDKHTDPRLLLLNAFGWLWTRHQKPTHPKWRPRDPTTRPAIRPPIPQVSDPPDLDPKEIQKVYGEKLKRR